MEYKRGDKLLCKKDLVHLVNSFDIDIIRFFSGEYYEFTNYKSINGRKPHAMGIRINNEYGWDFSFLVDYYISRKTGSYYIWDYFYTESEMRRLKLEKLKRSCL